MESLEEQLKETSKQEKEEEKERVSEESVVSDLHVSEYVVGLLSIITSDDYMLFLNFSCCERCLW